MLVMQHCRGDVDLNRDFPDPLLLGSTGLHPTGDEQPETLALMKWTTETRFVASASMHEVGKLSLLDLAFETKGRVVCKRAIKACKFACLLILCNSRCWQNYSIILANKSFST